VNDKEEELIVVSCTATRIQRIVRGSRTVTFKQLLENLIFLGDDDYILGGLLSKSKFNDMMIFLLPSSGLEMLLSQPSSLLGGTGSVAGVATRTIDDAAAGRRK
jgi:hypothetical protein